MKVFGDSRNDELRQGLFFRLVRFGEFLGSLFREYFCENVYEFFDDEFECFGGFVDESLPRIFLRALRYFAFDVSANASRSSSANYSVNASANSFDESFRGISAAKVSPTFSVDR